MNCKRRNYFSKSLKKLNDIFTKYSLPDNRQYRYHKAYHGQHSHISLHCCLFRLIPNFPLPVGIFCQSFRFLNSQLLHRRLHIYGFLFFTFRILEQLVKLLLFLIIPRFNVSDLFLRLLSGFSLARLQFLVLLLEFFVLFQHQVCTVQLHDFVAEILNLELESGYL